MHGREDLCVIRMKAVVDDVGELPKPSGADVPPNDAAHLGHAANTIDHFLQATQESLAPTSTLLFEIVSRLLDILTRVRA